MTDIIIIAVIAVIVAVAARYVYKAKKSGAKCIGCAVEGGCARKQGENACSCGCGGEKNTTDSCCCH